MKQGTLNKSQRTRLNNMSNIGEYSSVCAELMKEKKLKSCTINKESGEWTGRKV
jgi:hypothetical protein